MPYALCPMPYALCQIVPHVTEKGYRDNLLGVETKTIGFQRSADLRNHVPLTALSN